MAPLDVRLLWPTYALTPMRGVYQTALAVLLMAALGGLLWWGAEVVLRR